MGEDRIRREGELVSELIRRVPLIMAVLKIRKKNNFYHIESFAVERECYSLTLYSLKSVSSSSC